MIKDWLSYKEQKSKNIFRLIHVTESKTPDDKLIFLLQAEIIKSYRSLDYYKFFLDSANSKQIKEFLINQVIPGEKNQFDLIVRQGDFGEILAALIVTYFQDLEVPTNKLQWKINKDKAVFGTDLIAFNKGDKIQNLYYYEIKTRLNPQNKEGEKNDKKYVTIIAHDTLLKDKMAPNEAIAEFLVRLFFERKDFVNANKFKDVVLNPNNYKRNFELYFIIEKKNFIPDIISELNSLPPKLAPLCVTIIFIDNLKQLIDDTWFEIDKTLISIMGK